MTASTTQTPAEVMADARATYRQSAEFGMPLSGQKLGDMFGKSRSWGRDRIAEVKAEDEGQAPDPAGTANSGDSGGGTDSSAGGGTDTDTTGDDSDTPDTDTPEDPAPGGGATPVMPSTTTGPEEPVVVLAEVPQSGGQPVNAQVSAPATPVAVPAVEVADTRAPWQARVVAWASFLLGSAASVAANVEHAKDTPGAKLAGAFVPMALILAVEMMSRPIWQRPGWAWHAARYGGTGLVALVTAVMSYSHMHGLLLTYGETELNAAIGPLAVDGLMIVSGFAILAMNQKREKR
jgi:hypothetical protein